MKKLFALLLTAAIVLSLVACSEGNRKGDTNTAVTDEVLKATIITNEGDTVEMTAEELIEAYDSNEAKFKKLYEYAEIQFTGTVDYIKTNTSVLVEDGKVTSGQQKIVFIEGWCLVIGEDNTRYDLADYDPGDVVIVTTSIFGSPYDTDFLRQVNDNNRVVWLIGNDTIFGEQHGSVTTTIEFHNES